MEACFFTVKYLQGQVSTLTMLLGNPGYLLNVKGEDDVIKFPKLTYTKEDVPRIYHVFSIPLVQEVIQHISFIGEENSFIALS